MPVIDVVTDPEALTLTLTAEFEVPVERLWRAFTDPRQLERFWGPPNWPATFDAFDLAPGGRATYAMCGPEGERSAGVWEVLSVEEPTRIEVLDHFAGEDGEPNPDMPATRMEFRFDGTDRGSRLTSVSHFADHASLEQLVAMGMVEGATAAMAQLDTVLTDLDDLAALGLVLDRLDDLRVRFRRVLHGGADRVWAAHTDPELLPRWMLGPDGWDMSECSFDPRPGSSYHYAWSPRPGTEGQPFGFEGEVVLVDRGRRIVTTERMAGTDGPATLNDLMLHGEGDRTLLTLVVAYPDVELRDQVLGLGMADGMEASYRRLDRLAPG